MSGSLYASMMGGQPGALLPQATAAYAADPRTALVKSLMEQGQQELQTPTIGKGATLAKALTIGLAGLTNGWLNAQYQGQSEAAQQTLKDAIAAGAGVPAFTDPDTGKIDIPAVAPDYGKMQTLLASNPLLASQALQNQLSMAQSMAQAKANQTTELVKQGLGVNPATGTVQPIPGILPAKTALTTATSLGEQTGKNQADLSYKPAIAAATDAAENPALIARAGGIAGAEAPYKAAGTTTITVPGPNGPQMREVPISAAQLPAIASQNGVTSPPQAVIPPGAPDLPPGLAAHAAGGTVAPTVAPVPTVPAPAAANGTIQPAIEPKPIQNGAPVQQGSAAPTIGKPFAEPEVIAGRSKAFDDLRTGYNQGIQTLNQAKQLQNVLSQIPNTGPLTDQLGHLSAIAQQMGVDPETLKGMNLPNGATVQEAQKLRLDLLGEVLKAQFPGRITNADIKLWESSVPGDTALPQASDFLINQVVVPHATRDIGRFGVVANMPNSDPTLSGMDGALMNYDKGHPLPVPSVTPTGQAVPQGADYNALRAEAIRRGLIKQ